MGDKEKALSFWPKVSVKAMKASLEACTTPKEAVDLYCELAKELSQLVKTTLGNFEKEVSA